MSMNIGIIGAGHIARKMAYTINCMEDATCYAIASRNREKAKEFAKEYRIEKAYGSYEELVMDPKVELIYIATPHSHHYEHAKLCIEYKKAVLCEKPFMVNAKQTKAILELAKEKQTFISEAIWTRYMPSRRMIDDIITSGEIGEIVTATANLGYDISAIPRINDPLLAGGALLDVGIYALTFLSMVLGDEVERVVSTCVKTQTGVDAQNAMTLVYKDGKMGMASSNTLAATEQYGIVYGTKGYLIAENINNVNKINVYSKERKLVKELNVPPQITGFEDQVRSSMKAIREGEIEVSEIPHAQIIHMMELMDSIRADWGLQYPFE